MAIKDYLFLDEAGVQALSNYILTKVNSRIDDRIVKDPTGAEVSLIDDSHVISAAAIMNLLGGGEAGVGDGFGTQLADLKTKLDLLTSQVNSYSHLKIQTYIGDIEDIVDPVQDTFYFQKDAPAMDHDDEGFLLDADGQRVTNMDENDQPYYAYIDPDTEEVVKHDGVSIVQEDGHNVILDGEDPIFDTVKIIEDTTWSIYAYVNAKATPDSEPTLQWINFGDFDVELANYWSKSDEDIEELRSRLNIPTVTPLSEETIQSAVDAAFAATAPIFSKRETTVTILFKDKSGSVSVVGSQEVSAYIGEETNVAYEDMDVPEGYEIADKSNVGITFIALRDNTSVDVEVNKIIEKTTPDLSLTSDPTELIGKGSITLNLSGVPAGGTATLTCDDESVVPSVSSENVWTASLTQAKVYTFTANFAGDETHNAASAQVQVTVSKATPVLALAADPDSAVYNGSNQSVNLTLTGLPEDGTATVTCDDPTVIPAPGTENSWTAEVGPNAKEYTFTAHYDGDAINNAADATAKVTITKAEYSGQKTADGGTVNTDSDISVELPAIPDGASYGVPTGYTDGDITGVTIEGNTLKGHAVNAGSNNISIPVTGATNYNDYEITVSITINPAGGDTSDSD